MKRTLFIIVLLLISINIADANRLDIVGDMVVAETDNYVVHFEKGTFTYFHNKLTGETYTLLQGNYKVGGCSWAGKLGRGDETFLRAKTFQIEKIDALTARLVHESEQTHLTVFLSIDPKTSELIIKQEASSDRKSLATIWWTYSNLAIEGSEIIIPSSGGISYDASTPIETKNFHYPDSTWQAQLIIVQRAVGGFFVRSTDDTFRFKNLTYSRKGDSFHLGFSTQNDAPFDTLTSIKSVEWRLNTYTGGWRVPARQYQDWMEKTFQPKRLSEMPEWVEQINFWAHAGQDVDILYMLHALGVDTKQMIYTLPAVDDISTLTSPDYKLLDGYARVVKSAHQLGFRVFIIVGSRHLWQGDVRYETLKKYQMRNPWTGNGKSSGSDDSFHIFINPALVEYRKFLVEQMKKVYEYCPFDGIGMHATFLMENDLNGLVDGNRSPQGSILLQKELLEALPGVVLLGERSHEATFAHEAFASWKGLASDHPNSHPISTFIFGPYTRHIMSTGGNIDLEPAKVYNTLNSHRVRGNIPQIRLWHAYQLDENHTQARKMVQAVSQWQQQFPTIDLESDNLWNPDWTTLFLDAEAPTFKIDIKGDVFRNTKRFHGSDVNCDMTVNILDLVEVANMLGSHDPKYDLNNDRIIDIRDLVIVANYISQ